MNVPKTFEEAYIKANTDYFQIPAYFYAQRIEDTFHLTTYEPVEGEFYKYSSYLEMMYDLMKRGYASGGIKIVPSEKVMLSAKAEVWR